MARAFPPFVAAYSELNIAISQHILDGGAEVWSTWEAFERGQPPGVET